MQDATLAVTMKLATAEHIELLDELRGSGIGVSPQVIWPLGEPATVMKFVGPQKIIVGTGKVVSNIDTPPAGGCRTSVDLEMDNVADPRDCKGFHQPFIYGRLDRLFKQYFELSGIEAVPIA